MKINLIKIDCFLRRVGLLLLLEFNEDDFNYKGKMYSKRFPHKLFIVTFKTYEKLIKAS